MAIDADVIVVGAGLAGLVATAELADAGRRVLLLGLLALALLFGALGGGAALWQALLLLAGPIGCLALVLRRPVREWTTRGRAARPAGGRRAAPRSR